MSEVTFEMVHAAVKQAVKDGILPKKEVPIDVYEHHWASVERMIKAALNEA